MPTTRKKVIKTVYKDEDDSEADPGDFSDSGSDAVISQPSSSEDDEEPEVHNTSEDDKKTRKKSRSKTIRKPKLKKNVRAKVNQQTNPNKEEFDSEPKVEPTFSVKDLTDADKLLPSFLNLSESDSSDDEEPTKPSMSVPGITTHTNTNVDTEENELESSMEYQDVWSNNLEQSEEIARKTFQELEKHKSKLEETKQSIQNYTTKKEKTRESDVNDLLALGEEVLPLVSPPKIQKRKPTKARNKSDSEMEDWEEVAESTALPQQGLQLVVDFPGAVCRKTKKLDVEMMMKRKINRVKKEYQVYMHKVHVLCWLGHGNYVSQVLNDQEVMAAALTLMPSKECYPGERVDMKYVEQITTWFKDKITIKFDKNEGKFRPKAPPLKNLLLEQTKNRGVTSKKYVVYIFISMLRAVGLQCRIMLNFTTLPIKPPSSELCSLSTKPKINDNKKQKDGASIKESKKKVAKDSGDKIPQLDGNYDSSNDSDFDNIMQIDGNDDSSSSKVKTPVKGKSKIENNNVDDVSPPKRPRRNLSVKKGISDSKMITAIDKNEATASKENMKLDDKSEIVHQKVTRKSLSLNRSNTKNKDNISDNKSMYDTINKTPVKNLSLCKKTKSSNTKNKDNISDSSSKYENIRRTPVKSLSLRRERKQSNTNNKDNIGDSKSKDDNIDSTPVKSLSLGKERKPSSTKNKDNISDSKPKAENIGNTPVKNLSLRKRNITKKDEKPIVEHKVNADQKSPPKIIISETIAKVSSEYFDNGDPSESKRDARTRKRSHTSNPLKKQSDENNDQNIKKPRAKSVPGPVLNKSKYFEHNKTNAKVLSAAKKATPQSRKVKQDEFENEDSKSVSHRDLVKPKAKPKNDVTKELVNIIKNRVKEAKEEDKKVKSRKSSDDDSDYLPEETEQKPSISKKASKKPGTSRKIDRHIFSTDDEAPSKKIDVWCEIYVEELEQWIAVDVIKGRVHCVNEIYSGATHPVNYVVGWDNNNYVKDLTRRYVPHWNTVTRKQRVEPSWWSEAIKPWLGPRTPRDREEDECLDRLQLDAPLPKSIAEYKNHPLYALTRHLLKFEAIYPPDAATLGFVRGEPVYARECVYVCRSRDTWLKEAKVVRLGEQPYKVVKARPKWDKLSNKLITDKPLEVFGPWQVQDYEPPTAENGIVPRNAYGNVELFKECMLPKGTVHIKLPGLNRVAKKLNIDCAPAMTGFDFNGGWSHPVYDGFVVCQEFEEVMINAWKEDQEEQERKELEKIEARVYGNWKRLIKGLLIKERLKLKYGFTEPTTSQETKKKSAGPRLTVKKKC